MLCDKCGQNEASVHLCDIARGIPAEMHLCGACAEMFLPNEKADVANLLEQLPPRGEGNPRDAIYMEGPPATEAGEMEMTAMGQHVLVGTLGEETPRAISDPEEPSYGPTWSPDSSMIAHRFRRERMGADCLRVCSGDGREMQRFYRAFSREPIEWTGDSRGVCFCWLLNPEGGDWSAPVLADVRSGATRKIVNDPKLTEGGWALSNSGRQIAITSFNMETGESTLSVAEVETGNCRALLAKPLEGLLAPESWSPDDRFLAVIHTELPPEPEEGAEEELPALEGMSYILRVYEVSTGRQVFQVSGAFSSCWSPATETGAGRLLLATGAGEWFALSTTEVGKWNEPEEVGDRVQLPAGRLDGQLWSPDGKRIAFIGGREGACHVSDLNAPLPFREVTSAAWRPGSQELALLVGHEVKLVNPETPGKSTVAFKISSQDYYDVVGMRWSSDGKKLAIEAHSAEQAV